MCVRENESEFERAVVSVSRLKWGASRKTESVINYLMFDINLKFIVVCIFLLPEKAALHHGGFICYLSMSTIFLKKSQIYHRRI